MARTDPLVEAAAPILSAAILPLSHVSHPPGVCFLVEEFIRDLGGGRREVRTWLVTAASLTTEDVLTLHVLPGHSDPPDVLDFIYLSDQIDDWYRLGAVAVKHFGGLEAHAQRKGWSWDRAPLQAAQLETSPPASATTKGPFVATGFLHPNDLSPIEQFTLHAQTTWVDGLPQMPTTMAPDHVNGLIGAPVALPRPFQGQHRLRVAGLLVPDGDSLRVEPMTTVFAAIAQAVAGG